MSTRKRAKTASYLSMSLFMFVLGAGASSGQDVPPAGTGAVAGTVSGPGGVHLPGVVVSVVDARGAVIGRAVSADHGGYRVSGLSPGSYDIEAELEGFEAVRVTGISIGANRVSTADVRLQIESIEETVTVLASAPRESLEAPRLAESGARDVGEVLGSMAGMWKVRRGGIANDVVIRGYQGENLTVLIDGMRLYGACPNNMDHTAFHVDFAEVDRVEVSKGPFETKNQGGLGGAVNIVTRRPGDGFRASPQLTIGSYGFINPSLTASYGARGFAVLGGYSYRSSGAYTDGSGRSLLDSANYRPEAFERDAFEVQTGWGRLDLVPAAGHAIDLRYTRQNAGLVLYPYLQMDADYDRADRVNGGYTITPARGPVQAMRLRGYYSRVSHWMTDSLRVSASGRPRPYSMATMARTMTAGGRFEAAIGGAAAGFEVYRRGWDTVTELAMRAYAPQFSIPGVRVLSAGAFAEYKRALGSRLTLDAGARLDRTTNTADPDKAPLALYRAYHRTEMTSLSNLYPSGKIHLSFLALPGLTLTGGVGRTVRVPDPQERFIGLARMGTDWVGNPSLEVTRNTGVNAGFSYRNARFYVNGSVYRDALDNYVAVYDQARVEMVPGVMNPFARSCANVDGTISGGEIEAVVTVSDNLSVSADVSAVSGRQAPDSSRGIAADYLAEMPPMRSRIALRYDTRAERGGMFAEIEGVFSSAQDRVNVDVREERTPGYGLVNVRFGAVLRRARVTVGVANLFDRAYVEHLSYQRDPFRTGQKVYEPGRNVYVNVGFGFH